MLQAYQMMPLYIKGDHKKYGGNLSNVSKSIDLDMKWCHKTRSVCILQQS